jgi:hypothetical protein
MYGLNELAVQHVGCKDSNLIFVTDSNGDVIAAFVNKRKLKETALELGERLECVVEDHSGLIYDPHPCDSEE